MDLTHRFTVPVPIDEAWAHFNDIGSVAECFPGASVTSAEGDTFAGSVKVKLGPIALVYNGTGTFTEKDEAAHRMVVDAKGKDKRGNGTAGAAVVMTMTEAGTSTDIEVVTDLAITGKPAQFGRGVMQDVSDKLLGQFVACLEQRFEGAGGAEADVPEVAAVADVPEVPEARAAPVPAAAEPDATLIDEAAPAAVEVPPPAPAAAAAPPPAAPAAAVAGKRKKDDDALNLGTTVLPILFKTYWKQALAALVVLAIIIWLITRL
jgi:carbon monoxide dehydrogenase subunit G